MRKLIAVAVLAIGLVFGLGAAPALADNLNPPPYVGDPLSYHAEWDTFLLGTFGTGIDRDTASWVDDNDPNTFLYNAFGVTHLDFDTPYADWQLTASGFHNPVRDATFVANTGRAHPIASKSDIGICSVQEDIRKTSKAR